MPRCFRPLRRLVGWLVLAGTLTTWVSGCSDSSKVPPGADPEQMSESKYDVAVDTWRRRGHPREALGHALEAVELDDRNADALHLVALLYLDLCRLQPSDCRLGDAEQYARRAVEVRENFREAQNTLGVVLIHRKKYEGAIAVLKPLTADILYQTPENAWGNLGWAYLEKRQLDAAIDALRRSVAAQPMFCVGNYRLGLAYALKGESVQALEAYDRALDTSDPGCQSLQEAYLGRARVRDKVGEHDGAVDDLERCTKISERTKTGKECRSMLTKLK